MHYNNKHFGNLAELDTALEALEYVRSTRTAVLHHEQHGSWGMAISTTCISRYA